MSRHRNVRSLNYSDEVEGYDDVYGHSVEDDYSISPSAEQFMYDRTRQSQMSAFLREEPGIAEEDEGQEEDVPASPRRPQLNEVDEARLQSCLDEIRNVVGDSAPEHMLVDTILRCGFDIHRALDQVLNTTADKGADKPSQKDAAARDKDDKFRISSDTDFLRQKLGKMRVTPGLPTLCNRSSSKLPLGTAPENSSEGSLFSLMAKHPNEKTEATIPCENSLLSLMSKHQDGTEESGVNSNPPEGSLSSLMSKHQTSPLQETESTENSLFSLMAKHKPEIENQSETFPSLISLISQHKNVSKENDFSSFADLSAHHLKNTETNLFPNFGLPFKENLQPIDLTCAIKLNTEEPENKQFVKKRSPIIKPSIFIPHEANFEPMEVVEDRRPPLLSRRSSQLGQVLCRRWSNRFVPYVDMNPAPRTVRHFVFNSPSPDDLIIRALNKTLNKTAQ